MTEDMRYSKQDDPELEEAIRKRKEALGPYLSYIKKHPEYRERIIVPRNTKKERERK